MARGHKILHSEVIFQMLLMSVFFINTIESYIKVIPFSKRPKHLFAIISMGSENTLVSPQLRRNLDVGHSCLQLQDFAVDSHINHNNPYPNIYQDEDVDSPTVPSQTWELLRAALDIHLKNRFNSFQFFCIGSL